MPGLKIPSGSVISKFAAQNGREYTPGLTATSLVHHAPNNRGGTDLRQTICCADRLCTRVPCMPVSG